MARLSSRLGLTLVTVGSAAQARAIARVLVSERLAACVNTIGPISSVYRWHGAVERAREYLLVIKGPIDRFAIVARRIRRLHSYQVPEIVSVGFARASAPYLRWLLEATRPAGPARRKRGARSSSKS